MIKHLFLRNFKSWKEADIPMSKLTAFFGTNSSGKTSLLQFFLLLKQTVESADRKQVLHLGDGKSYVELGTFKDLIFKHNLENALQFQFQWTLPKKLKIADPEEKGKTLFEGEEMKFDATIREQKTGRLSVEEMKYQFGGWSFSQKRKKEDGNKYALKAEALPEATSRSFRIKRNRGKPWDLPAPVKCYGFPDQVNSYFQNAGFLSDLQLQLEELLKHVFYLGPLRDYPKRQYTWAGGEPGDMGFRGEKVVDALLASRKRAKIGRGKGRRQYSVEEYVAHWLKELRLIHSFRLEHIEDSGNLYRVKVQKTPLSAEVLLTDVGFGVSQILPVITLCYYAPPGSTLLIEQPEIHLHPAVQAGLADVFIDAIKVRDIQILLESHSEYLLKRLQRRIAEDKFLSSDARLYFCSMDREASRLTPLKLDEFGNITNWPENFFGDEMREIAAMQKAIIQRKLAQANGR
ncbi:MAG: DUF3696 domain-containing protein [Bacteroidetes bacterium]|nr:MAG: DUF3696 domain-containing protein [Bacteroidota bacterium]